MDKMIPLLSTFFLLCTVLYVGVAMPMSDNSESPSSANASSEMRADEQPQNINNTGIIVNGFNCTNYITQCKNNGQSLNVSENPIGSGVGEPNRPDDVCGGTQAQQLCGSFINNPVTTNVNNSTIVNQSQTNNNWININNPPPSEYAPEKIPIINQFPGVGGQPNGGM